MRADPFPTDTDLSLQHIHLEFTRIDILLHRQIQQQQLRQQTAPADSPLNPFYVTDEQAYALLQAPFGHGYASLSPEEDEPYLEALIQVEAQIGELVTAAESEGVLLRLPHLASFFQLDRFMLDVLLLTLAPSLDARYSKLYGYLQDDLTRKQPDINLILNLLCPSGSERLAYLAYFNDESALFLNRLVTKKGDGGERSPLITSQLTADESLVNWLLLGRYQPNQRLKPFLSFHLPAQLDISLLSAQLPAEWRQLLLEVVETAVIPPVLTFYDRDRLAQESAAAWLAVQLGQPLLQLDLARLIPAGIDPGEALTLLLRDALLTGSLPLITGWDSGLVDQYPPPELVQPLAAYPELLIVAGEQAWQPRQLNRSRRWHAFAFPLPDGARRQQLLTHFLEGVAEVDPETVSLLAAQFKLSTGQLRDLVQTAADLAAAAGGEMGSEQLFAAARTHSNPRLGLLARKISPRYDWQDLILPPEQAGILQEMVAYIRNRPFVLEQWGVGRKLAASAGVSALFFGPPGTGKTMAAEVMAGELGLDLYKIDLSTMVSKYIGETEKNLERIFQEAESSNAILFFDEADAIFGKRSEVKDAHDRYANIEVSYLLQRIEVYDGVTILSTNMRANLDDAFMRRLQFAVDFPFPKQADRERIWETLFPVNVPRTEDVDFRLLAERFEIAGGNIRNIIVSATYLAADDGRIVTMNHLLHSIRRELQKMGRLVADTPMQLADLSG